MYRIVIKARWNDATLAVWEVPGFLVAGIESVQGFIRDHIYKCSIFDDCVCRVIGPSADSSGTSLK